MRNSVPPEIPWGDIVGYSRAVRGRQPGFRCRARPRVVPRDKRCIPATGAADAVLLDRIDAALAKLGASLKDVVETRIYVRESASGKQWAGCTARCFRDIARDDAGRSKSADRVGSIGGIDAMAVVDGAERHRRSGPKPSERGYAAALAYRHQLGAGAGGRGMARFRPYRENRS